MKKKSFAKVNLSLDVVRKRGDGYHELDMVMVPIDLFDTISLEVSEKMEMTTNKGYIPIDDKNTIIKAINLMRDKYRFSENFKIKLVKNTPTQGGLGGGSSNAATTISMINEILNLEMTLEEMLEIGEKVGADVPFCVYGKPARVSGFGEVIKPIDYNIDFFMFIVKPKWGVSTPKAFGKLDLNNIIHPDINLVQSSLENNDYDTFIASIDNSLEAGAVKIVPKIKRIKKDLLKFGFDAAVMSGSGSTVFAITRDEDLIDRAVSKFVRKYHFIKKTRVLRDIRDEENI